MLVRFVLLLFISFICLQGQLKIVFGDHSKKRLETSNGATIHGHKVVKGNRNALYFLDNQGTIHLFPDFYTFTTLGFALTDIKKIPDEKLASMPIGDPIKALPAPPPFRPDDSTYHDLCEDPPRLVCTVQCRVL